MFSHCYNIEEIDMINWDMSNLKYENKFKYNPIDYLFCDCKKLKKLKLVEILNKKKLKKENLMEKYLVVFH